MTPGVLIYTQRSRQCRAEDERLGGATGQFSTLNAAG